MDDLRRASASASHQAHARHLARYCTIIAFTTAIAIAFCKGRAPLSPVGGRSLGERPVRGVPRHVHLAWLAYLPDAQRFGWHYLKLCLLLGDASDVHVLACGWPRMGK